MRRHAFVPSTVIRAGSGVLLLLLVLVAATPAHALSYGASVWTPLNSGTSQHLHGVEFVDPNTGWVVGNEGMILKTTDGGVRWTPQVSGVNNTYLSRVRFVNASTGWVVGGSGTILKTANGGVGWHSQGPGGLTGLNGLSFISETTGWAVGSGGTILKTVNGGGEWTPQDSGVTTYFDDVHFENENTGWVVGAFGTILKTTNGGTSWTPQDSGVTQSLRGVWFIDASNGWAVGDGNPNGVILKTTNGGLTWAPQTSGAGSLYSIRALDSNIAWAAGPGGIVKTLNGGATWAPQAWVPPSGLASLCMLDVNTLWAVGSSGTILKGMLPATTTITIKTAATSTYHGKTVLLSGLVTPYGMIGRNIVVWVKKPGKGYYSYSSNRTSYLLNGGAAWLYKYYFKPTMATGVYYFKASAPAPGFISSTGYVTSSSGVVTIRLR